MLERDAYILAGPTASGKIALAAALAREMSARILSADSMLVYKGMDIGTAKPPRAEIEEFGMGGVDLVTPAEEFSSGAWLRAAAEWARTVPRDRPLIIVGGTGLYIDSLLSGRDFAESGGGSPLRDALSAEYDRIGGEAFRAQLRAVDPERADKLHPADKKRLVRAMEVFRLTGETISAHDARTRSLPPRWDSLRYALTWADRAALYARIDRRVDEMVAAGLFDEVDGLLKAGLSPDCTAMQAIGYKEAAQYLLGRCGKAEAVDEIKQSSRRYAKRQLTWLRRDTQVRWITWDRAPDIPAAADRVAAEWKK